VPPQTRAPQQWLLITDAAQLKSLCQRLAAATRIAVDTEAASFHRYVDRVYLVQLSTDHETFLLDPLAVQDLAPVGELLSSSTVEAIFHDADYDLRVLDRDYGFHATRVFDTRLAAQFAGEPAVGLSALLDKHFAVKLDKRFQRADWSERPLTPAMLHYAADDTRYLPQLRDVLAERLDHLGRRMWAEEEFSRLPSVRWMRDRNDDDAYLRLKGAKALAPRSLGALRELFRWRESVARELDRAPFRVMPNEALLAVARRVPEKPADLQALRGFPRSLIGRYGDAVLDAVARGLAAPPDTIPRVRRGRRPEPDPQHDLRFERLRVLRAERAASTALDPGFVCPNGTLQILARAVPRSPADLDQIGELRRWQREVMGDARLLSAVGDHA
jgi:ribonuclease D